MDDPVAQALQARLGGAWACRALGASGFTGTWRCDGPDGTRLFVKSLPAAGADVLEAEADGLTALSGAVRVPAVAGCWQVPPLALLALEWLDFGPAAASFGAALGQALAVLHRAPPPAGDGRFGWRRDNRIGATVQTNRWAADWPGFFAEQRLRPMAARLPALAPQVLRLAGRIDRFFDDGHRPRPSLIHGDLWSGNWAALADGTPVLYDPAVSVSDAEAELAMMELFGQPPAGFWPAYRAAAGLAEGYERRRPLYQLYHLLNHALLFGGGYVGSCRELLRRLG